MSKFLHFQMRGFHQINKSIAFKKLISKIQLNEAENSDFGLNVSEGKSSKLSRKGREKVKNIWPIHKLHEEGI